ncbi:unnamed protein product [Closterium sp. NIES-53]
MLFASVCSRWRHLVKRQVTGLSLYKYRVISCQDLANAVACFDNLTNLHLGDCSVEIDDAFLARLASSRPKLKALHVGRRFTPTGCRGKHDLVTEAGLDINFQKCTQLEEISLHCFRKDTELPNSFFQLQHLHTVFLGYVSIVTLPIFATLSSLTSLDLDATGLTYQQLSSLVRIPRLSLLSISNRISISTNDSPAVTFTAAQLPHLKTLEFTSASPNFASMFPTGSPCIRLEQLVITNSANLERLPDDIGALLPCLRELTIRDCSEIDQLPDSITCLSALECLSILKCRQLHSLSNNFGELPALKSLMLHNLPGLDPPDSHSQATSLETLSLNDCGKMHLPAEFCSLTSLKTLSLMSFGKIGSELPDWIGWLSNLETLRLIHCKKEQLPPFIHATDFSYKH